jgi:division/cell wall cluster transcriptional repressor MraZ
MPPALELAKLSRPRLYRVSARERLFRALDELREHPVVWVSGAPGTGKSSLVASWLEARKLASVWYHVDPGDADPATFFHYLGLAAPARGRNAGPLPLYAEEYRRDLAGFTRRWFRELFARMPPGGVLVFDDFHDARTGHDERAALAAGLEEIPAGFTVVAVSRGQREAYRPHAAWEAVRTKVMGFPSFNTLASKGKRLLVGFAEEVELDNAGRMLVSPELRDFARLDKRVMMVGQGSHFEIWAVEAWAQQLADITAEPGQSLPPGMEDFAL